MRRGGIKQRLSELAAEENFLMDANLYRSDPRPTGPRTQSDFFHRWEINEPLERLEPLNLRSIRILDQDILGFVAIDLSFPGRK